MVVCDTKERKVTLMPSKCSSMTTTAMIPVGTTSANRINALATKSRARPETMFTSGAGDPLWSTLVEKNRVVGLLESGKLRLVIWCILMQLILAGNLRRWHCSRCSQSSLHRQPLHLDLHPGLLCPKIVSSLSLQMVKQVADRLAAIFPWSSRRIPKAGAQSAWLSSSTAD